MALLRELFQPAVAKTFQVENLLTKAKFWQSGAFVSDPRLSNLLNGGSPTFTVPHINPIDGNVESRYGNTVLSDIALPRTINGYSTQGRAAYLNDSFTESRLEKFLNGVSTNQLIATMLDDMWASQMDARAIATAQGLRNLDKTAKNLTNDISKDTATAGSGFSVEAYLETDGTLDESMQDNGVIVIHPLLATKLRIQQATEKVARTDALPPITMYNGREVVVSKRGTMIGSGKNARFISYLLSAGAFAAEFKRNRDDLELERTASTGNGAGHETLYTRSTSLIHPQGFSFIAEPDSLTGGTDRESISASWKDLQNGENWRMDSEAENIGIRFLITNL